MGGALKIYSIFRSSFFKWFIERVKAFKKQILEFISLTLLANFLHHGATVNAEQFFSATQT
jgi:hypothetical protein